MLFKFNKTSYDSDAFRKAVEVLLDDKTFIQEREKTLNMLKAWCVEMQMDILRYKTYQRKQSKDERKTEYYYDTKHDNII